MTPRFVDVAAAALDATVDGDLLAGLDDHDVADPDLLDSDREDLVEQIRITLLHEIGHQFGLDEDDLTELGYD